MDAFSLGLYMHRCVKDLAILLEKASDAQSNALTKPQGRKPTFVHFDYKFRPEFLENSPWHFFQAATVIKVIYGLLPDSYDPNRR